MGDTNADIDIDISRGAINCAKEHTNMWLNNEDDDKCTIIASAKTLIADKLNKSYDNIIKPIFPPLEDDIKTDTNEVDKIFLKWNNRISCEKWYDWFIIPDYHNGNKISIEYDTNGEYKCYNYCRYGIPYENNNCVNRDEIYNREFEGTLTITPYALIILMGSTKKDIIELYKDELENKTKNIENNLKYELEIDTNIKDKLIKDKDVQTEIFNKIKDEMKISINELIEKKLHNYSHKYIKGHNNVIPPINNLGILNKEPIDKYSNLTILNKAYEISKKLNDFLSNSNKDKEFQLWKQELKNISGNDIYSWKFNKQLLLLQSACMCCFSKQNKKNILYNLCNDYNQYILGNSYDKNIYNLNFKEITELQIFKATNEANTANEKEAEAAAVAAAAEAEAGGDPSLSVGSVTDNLYIYDIIDNSEDSFFKDKDININLLDNSFNSNIIMHFNFFILALLMIVFLFLIYKIITISSIWNSFAHVFTYILFGFIYIKEVMWFILVKALAACTIIPEPIWPKYAAKNSILKIHNGTIVGQSDYYKIKSQIDLKISNDKIKIFIYGCGLLIIIIVLLNQFMNATSILTKVKESSFNQNTSSIIGRWFSPKEISQDKLKEMKTTEKND